MLQWDLLLVMQLPNFEYHVQQLFWTLGFADIYIFFEIICCL
jgi:hypothetical protein